MILDPSVSGDITTPTARATPRAPAKKRLASWELSLREKRRLRDGRGLSEAASK